MHLRPTVGLAALLGFLWQMPPAAAAPPPEASPAAPAESRFRRYDKDGDGTLSREEFLAPAAGKRWFADALRYLSVYDGDGDGVLSLDEYRETPPGRGGARTGRVPDPAASLAAEAVTRFATWLSSHDEDGDGRLSRTEFRRADRGMSGPGRWGNDFEDWSRGASDAISVEEARVAAEIAYGIYGADSELLRDERGRVTRESVFRGRDQDSDGSLSFEEYSRHAADVEPARRKFSAADANGDGVLTLREFRATPVGLLDTVQAFKKADGDNDGRVGRPEFLAWAPQWERALSERSFPAFDLDGDGFLTFAEFRSTPAANPIGPSLQKLRDGDEDGKLAPREFAAAWEGGPPGLALLYFQRFDLDGDGFLDLDEFSFEIRLAAVPPEVAFRVRDADGDARLSLDELSDRHARPPADAAAELNRQRKLMQVEEELRAADADRDGLLSLTEFEALNAAEAGGAANPVSKARPPGPVAPSAAATALAPNRSLLGLDSLVWAVIALDVLLVAAAAWWWLRRRRATAGSVDRGAE